MSNQLFEAALGIKFPWFVKAVDFDAPQRRLTISVDFPRGSRFAHAQAPGQHSTAVMRAVRTRPKR